MANEHPIQVVTVTLNPAIDQTITIPQFAAGKVNRVEQTSSHPGGKGVNVAAALADYGVRVAATGFLGQENATCFEEMFARRTIQDEFIRIPGQTRTGIKIADPILQQTTDINFPGLAPTAAEVQAFTERVLSLIGDHVWFVVSGSLPPGLGAKTYATLLRELKSKGAKVLLDTSGEPLRAALAVRPDIIKPNIHELEWLIGGRLGSKEEIIAAARRLLAEGLTMAVVSMGEDGACFVTAEGAVVARPPRVQVKSTVGAGDAMVAGIIAGQLESLSLPETARLATAFSLEVLTRGQSGLGSIESVRRWMDQISIDPQ